MNKEINVSLNWTVWPFNSTACYTWLTNCEVWLVENQSCEVQQKRMYYGCTTRLVTWVLLTGVHYLDCPHHWSILRALFQTTAGGNFEESFFLFEQPVICLLNYAYSLVHNNVLRWQQNFEKRNINVTMVKQINCCTRDRFHGFCKPTGANGTLCFAPLHRIVILASWFQFTSKDNGYTRSIQIPRTVWQLRPVSLHHSNRIWATEQVQFRIGHQAVGKGVGITN